jgi:DNA-binding beta-propeller fold protein YncE
MNDRDKSPTRSWRPRLVCLALIVGAACKDSTGIPDNGLPVVTAITPATIPLGSAATEVTVFGTGFVEHTRVRLDGADRGTIWESDTELRVSLSATDFTTSGTRVLTVHSPPPGGGTSAPVLLLISLPVPVIDSTAPTLLLVGSATTTVTVFGTGFREGAAVSWDGADRPSVLVSSGRLTVAVNWTDLAVAGTHVIRVHHTGSQPDTSAGEEFTVARRAPRILSTAPEYATAGRAAFTLTVKGTDFAPGAVLYWNGAPRPTTFVSSTELNAAIDAADVAAVDTTTLRIENPAPAIGPSNAFPFAVRPAGHHILPFIVGDVAWDPVREVLYASVRSTDTTFPNRVIALNPMTGQVLRTVPVGSDPRTLALSDDMSVLYVALDGAAAIRRIDLTTFTAGLQFPLAYFGRILYADDIAVMPGHPGTVAVTHQVHGYSEGKGVGLAIYDDGVLRGSLSGGGTVLAFAGPDTLYTLGGSSSSGALARMLVTDSGAVFDPAVDGLSLLSFYADILYLNGFVFSSQGPIVDARQWAVVGSVQFGGTVAADRGTGRVFYMWQNTLSAIDATTFQVLGTQTIAGVPPLELPGYEAPGLTRWGVDGFAYRTYTSLVVFRSSLGVP